MWSERAVNTELRPRYIPERMPQETLEEREKRLEKERLIHDSVYTKATKGFVRGAIYGLGAGLATSVLAHRFCKQRNNRTCSLFLIFSALLSQSSPTN